MKSPRLLLLASVATPFALHAAVDFEKDIKPILETNCVRCHNPKGTEFEKGDTDLNLSTKEAAFESKSTIVAGNAEKSKLYTTTVLPDDAKKLMPPRNKVTNDLERLTKDETELVKNWINEGAQWPDGLTLTARKKEVASKGSTAETELVAKIHESILKSPAVASEQEMKAYTNTIPGSDITYDMLPIPAANSKWAVRTTNPATSPTKAPSTRWRSPLSGWKSARSHGTNSNSSCIRTRRRKRAKRRSSTRR